MMLSPKYLFQIVWKAIVIPTLSRCYAHAWRRAEPRGSWTKEKGRRNRTSEWSLAQKEKNEQEEDGGQMLNKMY